MCGIAGIIGVSAITSKLDLMLETQNHRGPDNKGKWFDSNVCLGHNRLSIIDLSEAANQLGVPQEETPPSIHPE